jgi:zinc/manganese transport system substrate-binding protein
VWFDPTRVAAGALLIADALASVDTSVDWNARAEEYGAQLLRVDAEVGAELMRVPAGSRKLVTNHDSLGYLANRYGYEVIGTVIPGGATLASPSSADLAALVSVIEDEGVPAIFGESTEPALLAEAVADEVGHGVVIVELFTGSLGAEDSGAETLLELLLTDAQRIAAALT